jgi:hypothetical protein
MMIMLLPNNIKPELSIYYNGAIILSFLKIENTQTIIELFEKVKQKNRISFSIFLLALDWLYLLEVVV